MAHTIQDALELCGVDNGALFGLFNAQTQAQRIAQDVFDGVFTSCMDKKVSELEDDWKTYAQLTIAQGQIRLRPATKKNIKALLQWTRDEIRMGRDPADTAFPVHDAAQLIKRYTTHQQWLKKATDKASTAMPKQFTEQSKWLDWKGSFINFLRTQPGRDGVPLSYVIRDEVNPPNPRIPPNAEFLDDYVDNAPLVGETFSSDAGEVHTYLVNLISSNAVAENKIMPFIADRNGRRSFQALRDHYEGVGANATAVVSAEEDIDNLFYSGEKKPHMWWEEFETRLTVAFATIDKDQGRQVYTDIAKLRMLNKKIKADFLEQVKVSIEIELAKVPITMTYDIALASYRNTVNRKHPPNKEVKKTRRINETTSTSSSRGNQRGRGRGRGRGHGRGIGRGRHQGRGGNQGNKRQRNDAWFIQDINGNRMEVHPAYKFNDDEWHKIPQTVQQQLIHMRQEYKRSRQSYSSHSSVQYPAAHQQIGAVSYHTPQYPLPPVAHVPAPPPPPPPAIANNDQRSTISEMTTDRNNHAGSIMGGRNEQVSLRS